MSTILIAAVFLFVGSIASGSTPPPSTNIGFLQAVTTDRAAERLHEKLLAGNASAEKPPVIAPLRFSNFMEEVMEEHDFIVTLYYTNDEKKCEHCEMVAGKFLQLASEFQEFMRFMQVDLSSQNNKDGQKLATTFDVTKFPAIHMFQADAEPFLTNNRSASDDEEEDDEEREKAKKLRRAKLPKIYSGNANIEDLRRFVLSHFTDRASVMNISTESEFWRAQAHVDVETYPKFVLFTPEYESPLYYTALSNRFRYRADFLLVTPRVLQAMTMPSKLDDESLAKDDPHYKFLSEDEKLRLKPKVPQINHRNLMNRLKAMNLTATGPQLAMYLNNATQVEFFNAARFGFEHPSTARFIQDFCTEEKSDEFALTRRELRNETDKAMLELRHEFVSAQIVYRTIAVNDVDKEWTYALRGDRRAPRQFDPTYDYHQYTSLVDMCNEDNRTSKHSGRVCGLIVFNRHHYAEIDSTYVEKMAAAADRVVRWLKPNMLVPLRFIVVANNGTTAVDTKRRGKKEGVAAGSPQAYLLLKHLGVHSLGTHPRAPELWAEEKAKHGGRDYGKTHFAPTAELVFVHTKRHAALHCPTLVAPLSDVPAPTETSIAQITEDDVGSQATRRNKRKAEDDEGSKEDPIVREWSSQAMRCFEGRVNVDSEWQRYEDEGLGIVPSRFRKGKQ